MADNPRVNPRPDFLWIWDGWHRLGADRPQYPFGFIHPMGGGVISTRPGATPWMIVRHWAACHGFSEAEYRLFDHCITAMDRVALTYWDQKHKSVGTS